MIRRILLALALLCAPALAQAQGVVSGLNPSTGGGTASCTGPAYDTASPWMLSAPFNTVGSTGGVATNQVRLLPLVVSCKTITVSDLAVYITTAAASGSAQLVIYPNAAGNLAKSNWLAWCAVSTASTGNVSCALSSGSGSNVTLAPGLYWIGTIVDGTAGGTVAFDGIDTGRSGLVQHYAGASALSGLLSASAYSTGRQASVTYSASAPPDLTSTGAGNGFLSVPLVAIKISAVAP